MFFFLYKLDNTSAFSTFNVEHTRVRFSKRNKIFIRQTEVGLEYTEYYCMVHELYYKELSLYSICKF